MIVVVVIVVVVIVVMAKVDADVEMLVIPISFVIPAPLPRSVHLGDIVFDLVTVFAVAGCIPINPRTVRFQPSMAFVFPILVCASSACESEHKSAGQQAGKNRPIPY
jgi:hypothetical protein